MTKQLNITAIACLLVLTLSACGSGEKNPTSEPKVAAKPTPTATPQFDPAAAEVIMNEPMDGSSVEAFAENLEKLKATLSEEDFGRVQSALDWMLFYDFSVGGDKEKLYTKLNGVTPSEIISRARRK